MIERSHQTIAQDIRTWRLAEEIWDSTMVHSLLQSVAWGLQSTFYTALQNTTGQLVFGRDMVINTTYLANWRYLKQRRQGIVHDNTNRENHTRIPHAFKIGTQVYLRDRDIKRKLQPNAGPFDITEVHTNGMVTIRLSPILTQRFNICRLMPAFSPSGWEASVMRC